MGGGTSSYIASYTLLSEIFLRFHSLSGSETFFVFLGVGWLLMVDG